jgi:hypothetical protein
MLDALATFTTLMDVVKAGLDTSTWAQHELGLLEPDHLYVESVAAVVTDEAHRLRANRQITLTINREPFAQGY